MKSNIRHLANLFCLIIESLFKAELIASYTENQLNEFIKNSYEIFERKREKEQIAEVYKKMNINIEKLITKAEVKKEVETDSDD